MPKLRPESTISTGCVCWGFDLDHSMSKIFTRNFRSRFSEVDAFGRVGSAHILRYFIETAWDWGASEDINLQQSQKLDLLWLVREMEFETYQPLRYDESFSITLWMMEWRRVRGSRGFELHSAENNALLMRGVNQVALLDPETLRPIPGPQELIDRFRLENPQNIPYQRFPRFPEPPEGAYRTVCQVEWRDLDVYRHVNNAVYADYMEEAAMQALAEAGWPVARLLEAGLAVENRHFHIQFQEPALWGERLDILTWVSDLSESGGQRWTAITRQSNQAPIAAQRTTWQVSDLQSGAAQALPEELRRSLSRD